MDDINNTLQNILSDPQKMQQIQGMIQNLQGGAQPQPPAQKATPPTVPASGLPNLSALNGLLGSLSGPAATAPATALPNSDMVQMMTRIGPLLQQVQAEDDSTRLLRALRPLLSPPRQKRLDESLRMLQLMRMLPLLKESGILANL